ncbi:MAG TPA: hypothetical protein VK790_01075, partial [Solirubrobacteraceae bacterium]|nr:hypothetical protein [Solirubrobacteraceae bacterium]
GVPVAFSTPAAPPVVSGEAASSVRGVEARVEAVVNPDNELAECHVQYGTSSLAEHEVPCEPEVLKGYGEDGVAATLPGLEPDTPYQWRVTTESEQSRKEGKPAVGPTEHFTTKIPPETPETLEPQGVTGTTATLEGILNPHNPGEAGTYTFVYQQSPTACQGAGEASVPQPEGSSAGGTSEPVSEPVNGLLANTTYTYCLRTVNSVSEVAVSAPRTFTTPAIAAKAGEESFTNVGSSTAVLHAQINAGGAPTTFYFEYGPTNTYGTKTPVQSAGAAPTPVGVLASVENLTPDSTYHFRVIATNTNERTSEGADTTFSTYPASPLGLPDDRGYELVSPLNTASNITVLPGGPTQATADGNEVVYVGNAGAEGGNGGQGGGFEIINKGTNAYLAKRSPTGGWTTENLQPTGLLTAGFQGFSSDLTQGFLTSEEPVFEGAPAGQALYARENTNSSYQLLAANANYAGSTPDASHILFSSEGTLYDSVQGQPKTVSVLPNGTTATSPVFGSPQSFAGIEQGFPTAQDLTNVISDDGSRVFWTTTEPGEVEIQGRKFEITRAKALYVREDDASSEPRTVQLDAAEPACLSEGNCVSGGGVFEGATLDGSTVFFSDEHRLTASSTAGPGKPDLYRYQVNPEAGKPGALTDLTPDSSESADVAGVLGASEDGATVYFAAAGTLAATAQPQECIPPTELGGSPSNDHTRCNVYVVHDAEAPKLVATVKAIDGIDRAEESGGFELSGGDWTPTVGDRSARVSADGRHLVFMSRESLTGFDSKGNIEIYLYDLGSGVSCVSCNPSGTPTELESRQSEGSHHKAEQIVLPRSNRATYGLRVLSDAGDRVFFESDEALVPALADASMTTPKFTHGIFNVYEWERAGSGSCTTAAGCIYLLSGGTSSDSSFFIDASVEGEDVFIGSRAQLVPEDHGEAWEVFDARVGTTPPPAAPVCSGAGCQGVPGAPPIFATPASVTFNGAGNFPPPPTASVKVKSAAQVRAEKLAKALRACRKDKAKRRRTSCEKTARRRYGAGKASRAVRASNDRRAN